MAELDAFELGESREEMARKPLKRLRTVIVGGADASAEVVDGVVPAPQDAVVSSLSMPRTGEFSRMSTPASTHALASSAASFPGCTRAVARVLHNPPW